MGCVKKVTPWLVDPLGTFIHQTTGFGYTPGGALDATLNRPAAPARTTAQPATTPQLPTPPTPPSWRPTAPLAPTRARVERTPPGAGPSADTTRGLLKRGGGRSLLQE